MNKKDKINFIAAANAAAYRRAIDNMSPEEFNDLVFNTPPPPDISDITETIDIDYEEVKPKQLNP